MMTIMLQCFVENNEFSLRGIASSFAFFARNGEAFFFVNIPHLSLSGVPQSALQFINIVLAVILLTLIVLIVYFYQQYKTLAERANRLETLIEAADLGYWEWNYQTGKVKVNQQWADLRGIQKNDPVLKTSDGWRQFVHKEDREAAETQMNLVVQRRASFYKTVFRANRADGKLVWIQNYGKVIRWTKDQKPLLLMGINWDITEQQVAMQKASDSETLMRYAIENAKSGVAIFDKEMRYVYVSKRFHHMYGVYRTDVIGKSHYEIFPDLPEKWRVVHQKALQGIVSSQDRDVFVHENGHKEYTRWECRPWVDSLGEIQGVVLYSEVINDQVNNEIELKKSKDTLQAIVDHLPIGVALHDLHPFTKFQYINENYFQLLNLTTNDIQSITGFWSALFGNDPRREYYQKLIAELSDHDQDEISLTNVPLQQGNRIRYVSVKMNRIPTTNQWISTVVDVTESNLKQQEIQHASTHDFLTGLYNRRYFQDYLEGLDLTQLDSVTIVMIDVNGLKMINDAFGFRAGDQLLKMVSNAIMNCCVIEKKVCRIGGDEFSIVLLNQTEEMVQKNIIALKDHIATLSISNVTLSIAIGSATGTKDTHYKIEELIQKAETRMYKQKVLDSRSMKNQAIQGILQTINDKFETEKLHSHRVSELCVLMGQALKLESDQIEELRLAGLFHDVGKITIPDAVLAKPGKLTKEEYEIIKQHPERGYHILRTADQYSDLAQYALSHHERIDGLGYPMGLKGPDIPLFSKIIGICDAFEAMTADRPYRKALSIEYAIDQLLAHRGTQFDAELVDLFIRDIFPNTKKS